MFRRIEGRLVDATEFFFSRDLAYKLKQAVLEDTELVLQRASLKDKQGLQEAREWFKNCNDLTEMGRVLAVRERFTKHLLVQWGYVDPISNYASIEEERKFSFGFGHESKGAIHGDMFTLPRPWDIQEPPIGECTVHMFRPHNRNIGTKEVNPPEHLAKMMLYAPMVVLSRDREKSMERLLEQKDHTISDLTEKNERLAALADTYKSMLSIPEGEKLKLPSSLPSRFGVVDILLLGAPPFIGYLLADYLGYDVLIGVVIGLIAGTLAVYRRLRR